MNTLEELEGEVADLGAQVAYLTKNLAAAISGYDYDQLSVPEAACEFEARVTALRMAGASGTEALSKARRENPEVFNAYRAADVSSPPIRKRAPVSKSVTDFMTVVDRTMIEKRLSRTAAMSDVRKRCPELFESLQEG